MNTPSQISTSRNRQFLDQTTDNNTSQDNLLKTTADPKQHEIKAYLDERQQILGGGSWECLEQWEVNGEGRRR